MSEESKWREPDLPEVVAHWPAIDFLRFYKQQLEKRPAAVKRCCFLNSCSRFTFNIGYFKNWTSPLCTSVTCCVPVCLVLPQARSVSKCFNIFLQYLTFIKENIVNNFYKVYTWYGGHLSSKVIRIFLLKSKIIKRIHKSFLFGFSALRSQWSQVYLLKNVIRKNLCV